MREHPRVRGEYILMILLGIAGMGTPPRARGIHPDDTTRNSWHGNTPACAGNTNGILRRLLSSREHPRVRGEYVLGRKLLRFILGTPPRARGIPYYGLFRVRYHDQYR